MSYDSRTASTTQIFSSCIFCYESIFACVFMFNSNAKIQVHYFKRDSQLSTISTVTNQEKINHLHDISPQIE